MLCLTTDFPTKNISKEMETEQYRKVVNYGKTGYTEKCCHWHLHGAVYFGGSLLILGLITRYITVGLSSKLCWWETEAMQWRIRLAVFIQMGEIEKDTKGLIRNKADIQQPWSWGSKYLAMLHLVNVFWSCQKFRWILLLPTLLFFHCI